MAELSGGALKRKKTLLPGSVPTVQPQCHVVGGHLKRSGSAQAHQPKRSRASAKLEIARLMRNNGPHPTDAPESIQPPPDYIQVVACQTDAKCLTDQGTQLTALKPVKTFTKGINTTKKVMVETATQTSPVSATNTMPVTTRAPTKDRMPADAISPSSPVGASSLLTAPTQKGKKSKMG
ncbi:hypothetical protein NP493_1158g00034 [Ridgeia piscesae]|uniref:Uncharacterized protein n=1 Tax=Ridgeia piscesae TaxID=27915 RepID=A0AAD9NK80_RIDPI|nr:hypothetical protein NP493_1158g00034 [Ridgeia piscesae]